jgi:hypothetical protein
MARDEMHVQIMLHEVTKVEKWSCNLGDFLGEPRTVISLQDPSPASEFLWTLKEPEVAFDTL